jgi:hypothetical protein
MQANEALALTKLNYGRSAACAFAKQFNHGRGVPCAPADPHIDEFMRYVQNLLRGTFYCSILLVSSLMLFAPSSRANTSATNSGLLVSAPQLGSDTVTIMATNSSDKSISFSAKISYTYESFSGDRVSGNKTVSETLVAGQSDAAAGTISERRIQVDKVTIFSVSSF